VADSLQIVITFKELTELSYLKNSIIFVIYLLCDIRNGKIKKEKKKRKEKH
jgi:hypothetical protein